MTDPDMDVIREKVQILEERHIERREELRRDFEFQAHLLDAVNAARYPAIIGLVPSVAWMIRATGMATHPLPAIVFLAFGLFLAAVTGYVAPYVGGLATRLLVRETRTSVTLVSIVSALLVDAAFFGWVLVLTL